MTKQRKRSLAYGIAGLFLLAGWLLPTSEGLSREALCVIGIFGASLTLWIGVSIDWPSFVTILLAGFLPSVGFRSAFATAFGNSTVAFLLLTFLLVYPLSQTGFVRRCAIRFITSPLSRRGRWHFVGLLFASVTLMGWFISPSVLFVAFLPFLEEILRLLQMEKGSKSGRMLMMGTAFCISLSSGMTPIGHVWPTLAMAAYSSATGNSISPFQYMAVGIPTGLAAQALMMAMFRWLYRPDDLEKMDPAGVMSLKEEMPRADKKEKIILWAMGITVFLWIGPSLLKGVLPGFYELVSGWTTAFPPLVGCLILFFARPDGRQILDFGETSRKGVLWGAVLMTGAATLLGSCLTNEQIGISAWLSGVMAPLAGGFSETGLVLFFSVWTVLETNFSSNIVTTTVVSSIAAAVCAALPQGERILPVILCLVGFGASVCNMTPAGQSTINTVAIGSGWTDAKSMFLWGFVFALIAIGCMVAVGYPLGLLVF